MNGSLQPSGSVTKDVLVPHVSGIDLFVDNPKPVPLFTDSLGLYALIHIPTIPMKTSSLGK